MGVAGSGCFAGKGRTYHSLTSEKEAEHILADVIQLG